MTRKLKRVLSDSGRNSLSSWMKATQNEVCLHSMAGLSQHHVYMQQSFLFVRPCLFHRAEDQMPLLHFLNSNLIFPKLISLQSLSCEMSSLTIPARDCLTLHYGIHPPFWPSIGSPSFPRHSYHSEINSGARFQPPSSWRTRWPWMQNPRTGTDRRCLQSILVTSSSAGISEATQNFQRRT